MATERASYIFDAQTNQYVSAVDKASNATDELTDSTKQTTNANDGMNKGLLGSIPTWGKVVAGALGAVKAFSLVAESMVNVDVANAKTQSQMELTDAQMQEVIATNKDLASSYGLTGSEIATVSSNNSAYAKSSEELIMMNELTAQSATLLALKEGDLANVSNYLITAQDALIDTLITGSTTGWEDTRINVERLSEELIKNMEITEAQADVIAEGTTTQFEYAEALWRSANESQRLNALSTVTAETMEELFYALDPVTQGFLLFKKTLNELVATFKAVIGGIVKVIMGAVAFASAVAYAVSQTEFWQSTMEILQEVIEDLQPVIEALASVIAFILGGAVVIVMSLFAFWVNILNSFVIPALETFGNFIETYILPIVEELANFLQEFFIPIFETIGEVLLGLQPYWEAFTEAVQSLATVFIETLMPIIETFIENVQEILLILQPAIEAFLVLAGALLGLGLVILELIGTVLEPFIEVIGAIIEAFQELLDPVITALAEFFNGKLTAAFEDLTAIIETITVTIQNFTAGVEEAGGLLRYLFERVIEVANSIKNELASAFDFIIEPINNVIAGIQGIIDVISDAITSVQNFASEIRNNLNDALSSIPVVGGLFGDSNAQVGSLSAFGGTGQSSLNSSNVQNSNTVNYTVYTTKRQSLRSALREKNLYDGGVAKI